LSRGRNDRNPSESPCVLPDVMTNEWTIRERRFSGTRVEAGGYVPLAEPRQGFGQLVSMAYREPLRDLPDDMLRLLARLN
jgi:hypothetical protein